MKNGAKFVTFSQKNTNDENIEIIDFLLCVTFNF